MTADESQTVPTAAAGKIIDFDQVIAPLSRDAFISEFWGKSFVHQTGETGRFRSLISWDDLNSILEKHRLEPPRLRLVRDGKTIDPKLYMGGSKFRSGLNPAGLMNCLGEGATLVLSNVDELAPAVGQLAEAFQEVLRSETTVNLYAGWRVQKGFDLHWDPQDTMILQLIGRKHWKVYQPTRLHPFKEEVEETPRPVGEPKWEGLLEDGDMIYLPRGWWHVAFPLDEPSLHLTVTIVPANGKDLLRWFVEQLKNNSEVRMNVPHLANGKDRKQYVARIRELLMECAPDDVLDKFMGEWEARIPWQPQFRLPFAPAESRAPITVETNVRLASSRRVLFMTHSVNGTVAFVIGGIHGECSIDLVPALKLLSGKVSRSVGGLCDQLPDQDTTSKLMILLTALAMRGAVQIEPRELS